MGRRRPWVIGAQICAFIASTGLLFVRDPPTKYITALVVAFFVHSIFASIQDASVDAQAITSIPLHERGRINGFMRGGFLVGSALGAAGLSWVLRNWSYLAAASINSSFLFLFTFITFFIKEKSDDQLFPCNRQKFARRRQQYQPTNDYSYLRLFVELFKGLLSPQSLRLFIPILVVYATQAAFIRAYNSKLFFEIPGKEQQRLSLPVHLIKVLGWSDTSVSILSGAWGTLIVIGVVLIGGWLADRVGARRLLIVVIFIHACYMLTANLVEPYWHKKPVATAVLILWNMMDPILSTASMPVLMALCRTHVEGKTADIDQKTKSLLLLLLGSQFTTYMSLVNLCDLAGAFVSGQLQRHFRANVIGLGCAILIIFAFIVVTFGIWYDSRQATSTPDTPEQTKAINRKSPKYCWPIHLFTNYRRGTFKVIV